MDLHLLCFELSKVTTKLEKLAAVEPIYHNISGNLINYTSHLIFARNSWIDFGALM